MLQTAAVLRAASRWAAAGSPHCSRSLVYFPHYFGPAARHQPPCHPAGGRHLYSTVQPPATAAAQFSTVPVSPCREPPPATAAVSAAAYF